MKITIVTPSYNAESYIAETINSVRQQTHADWEYLVVDDGSTDGSRAIVAAIAVDEPRLKLISQMNQGVAAARNAGLHASSASSEYIIFLDNDDLWAPDTLEVLSRWLDSHTDHVAVFGLATYLETPQIASLPTDIESFGRERYGVLDGVLKLLPADAPSGFANLAYFNTISTPGQVLVRRSAIEQVGLFDPRTAPADDWDMWIRLSRLGDIGFLDRSVISWRQHSGNASLKTSRMRQAIIYVQRKTILSDANTPAQRRMALMAYKRNVQQRIKHGIVAARRSLSKADPATALVQISSALRPVAEYGLSTLVLATHRLRP